MSSGGVAFCGKCGYELTGLHFAGRCPECGHDYDMGTGVGLSSDASRRAERGSFLMRRLLTIVLLGVTLLIAAIGALTAWGMGSYRPAIWAGMFVALFGMATLTSFVYEKSEG